MNEVNSKTHVGRLEDVEKEKPQIEYGNDVANCLSNLVDAVHGDREFDGDLKMNMRIMSMKPRGNADYVIPLLLETAIAVQKHIERTKDDVATELLEQLRQGLWKAGPKVTSGRGTYFDMD